MKRQTPTQRLREIAGIVKAVQKRCDMPHTRDLPMSCEIEEEELRRIFMLAVGA